MGMNFTSKILHPLSKQGLNPGDGSKRIKPASYGFWEKSTINAGRIHQLINSHQEKAGGSPQNNQAFRKIRDERSRGNTR